MSMSGIQNGDFRSPTRKPEQELESISPKGDIDASKREKNKLRAARAGPERPFATETKLEADLPDVYDLI